MREYEAARTSGAKALLDTASEIQPQVKVPESEIDLQSLAAQLAKQASELDIRESILAEKADHLQKAQERLEKQIELLTSRVKSEQEDSDESFDIRRVICEKPFFNNINIISSGEKREEDVRALLYL